MTTTLKSIAEAFTALFEALHDRQFRKTTALGVLNEQALLWPMRFFLLGWFKRQALNVEQTVSFPWTKSGKGRIDFLIDGVAVEVAVRTPGTGKSNLLEAMNRSEIVKLMMHPDKAMLVLFDFSRDPLSYEQLQLFREVPTLEGDHDLSAFHLYYFNRHNGRRNVRAGVQDSPYSPFKMKIMAR